MIDRKYYIDQVRKTMERYENANLQIDEILALLDDAFNEGSNEGYINGYNEGYDIARNGGADTGRFRN